MPVLTFDDLEEKASKGALTFDDIEPDRPIPSMTSSLTVPKAIEMLSRAASTPPAAALTKLISPKAGEAYERFLQKPLPPVEWLYKNVSLHPLYSAGANYLAAKEGKAGEIGKAAVGAIEGLDEVTDFFRSPQGIALGIAGGLPPAAQRAVSAGFALQMASQLPEDYKGLVKSVRSGDTKEISKSLTKGLSTLAMTGAAGAHAALGPRARVPVRTGMTPEEAAANRAAVNLASPGTMRPGEMRAFAPPAPEAPSEMVTAELPPKFSQVVGKGPVEFLEPPEPFPEPEPPPKVQAETRGKVSFGAEAPTLLRESISPREEPAAVEAAQPEKVYAPEERKIEEGVQPERVGTEAQRIPPETGVSDSLQPTAEKPGGEGTVSPPEKAAEVLLKETPVAETSAERGKLGAQQLLERYSADLSDIKRRLSVRKGVSQGTRDVLVKERIRLEGIIRQLRGAIDRKEDLSIYESDYIAPKPPAAEPAAEPIKVVDIKEGDVIRWEPNENERRYQGPVEGIVQDVITSGTEGEIGFHIFSPTKGDPNRVVRVWANRGKVVSREPAKVESKPMGEEGGIRREISGQGRNYPRLKTVVEIADEIAAKGVDPQASYGQFVKARDLKPEISAKEWLPIYRRSLELARLKKLSESQPPSLPSAPKPKEPWEMTRDEYLKSGLGPKPVKAFGESTAASLRKRRYELAEKSHAIEVKQALAEGKSVPPEVLKDYPDLQKPQPPAAPTTTAEGEGKGITIKPVKGLSIKRYNGYGFIDPNQRWQVMRGDKIVAEYETSTQGAAQAAFRATFGREPNELELQSAIDALRAIPSGRGHQKAFETQAKKLILERFKQPPPAAPAEGGETRSDFGNFRREVG